MKEIWKSVPKAEKFYEISNKGRLRQIAKGRYGRNCKVGDILTAYSNKNCRGYIYYRLTINGKRISKSAHRLVAQTFIGLCPYGYEVNHKDRNTSNNFVNNLEYITAKDNKSRGQNHYLATLTTQEVVKIKKLLKTKIKQKDIAKIFNVSIYVISMIKCNINWSHISAPPITIVSNS